MGRAREVLDGTGVDTGMLALFEEAKPRWDRASSTPFVSPALAGDREGMRKIEAVCLYSYSWVNFINSRFGGVGRSARRWLLSAFRGLDALYEETRLDPNVSR